MKRYLILFAVSLTLMSCTNNNQSEKEIEALNEAAADSLLQDALKEDTIGNHISKDSI